MPHTCKIPGSYPSWWRETLPDPDPDPDPGALAQLMSCPTSVAQAWIDSVPSAPVMCMWPPTSSLNHDMEPIFILSLKSDSNSLFMREQVCIACCMGEDGSKE